MDEIVVKSKSGEGQIKCNSCDNYFPISSILKHISKTKSCSKKLSSQNVGQIREICKENKKSRLKLYHAKRYQENKASVQAKYQQNKHKILEEQRVYQAANSVTITKRKGQYYQNETNRKRFKESSATQYAKKKQELKQWENHRHTFKSEIEWGPIFPCVCCMRDMFLRGVQDFTDDFNDFLSSNNLQKYIDKKYDVNGCHYICHNCKSYLLKKKMPRLWFYNGLKLAEIPDCLKELKGIEKQLIKKNLPFLKVRRQLPPKTRMDVINDRVVNVPMHDDDIVKNVTSLPRTKESSGFINIMWKRRLKYKTYYQMQAVRPDKIYKALEYLKNHNPFYRDMKLLPYAEFLKDCENNDSSQDLSEVGQDSSDSSDSESIEDIPDETESAFNNVTCIVPEDLSSEVIVSTKQLKQ